MDIRKADQSRAGRVVNTQSRGIVMQRYLIAIVMSSLALVYTGFATSGGARNSQVQVDEMQNAAWSKDPPQAELTESAAGPASLRPGPRPAQDPCPCVLPICRPGCSQAQV